MTTVASSRFRAVGWPVAIALIGFALWLVPWRVFFSSSEFMPHGHCYSWEPGVVWLNVISDGFIAVAYYSIPFLLVYFIRKRRDVVFDWMFLCFAVFILACGTTHVMDVLTIWQPFYWLAGAIKALTAIASMATAVLLLQLMPRALAMPTSTDLRAANSSLQREISERRQDEEEIKRLNERLEHRVQERTRELQTANQSLRHEIAERQRAEEAVHQLNAELELRVNRRTEQLELANRELEAFSYSVSHDLRAPLRAIEGFARALQENYAETLDDEGRRYIERIRASTQRMGDLIRDLLELSRLTRSEMRREQVNLSGLAASVIQELKQANPARTVAVEIQSGMVANADPELIRAAFENLLANAWKFTRNCAEARIDVGTRSLENETAYFVRDNGAGFDMTYVNRLFGAFQRLHSISEFEGTGVGLATVQRIIRRHGGRVWAEGTVGEGATFYFTLPG